MTVEDSCLASRFSYNGGMLLPAVAPLLSLSPQAGLGKGPSLSATTIPSFSKVDRRRLLQAGLPGVTLAENLAEPTVLRFLEPGNANESLLVTGSVAFTNEKGGVAQLFDFTSAGQGIGQMKATFRATKGATYALLFVGRSTTSSVIYTYGSGTSTWGTGTATITPGSQGFVIGATAKGTGPLTITIGPTSSKTYGVYCEVQRIEVTRL
ncbi:hypothetical protein EON79_18985 [bacterium]|nr:MAG: hypothetical protein EON79_18985 [bacterium]